MLVRRPGVVWKSSKNRTFIRGVEMLSGKRVGILCEYNYEDLELQ